MSRQGKRGARTSRLLGSCALVAIASQGLAQEVVELSEVKVTAKAVEAQEMRRNASAGKIVYGRDELETMDAASIGELLSKLPGTGMFADPDNSPRGRGRGPDRNMPQILVDGQPLPGGGRNPATALRLPVELIERVEIIRNSTAEFPVLGTGGVVNLILRDVPNKRVASAKVGVGVTGGEPALRLEGQYGEPDGGNFGYLLSGAINSRSNIGRSSRHVASYTGGVQTGTLDEYSENRGQDTNLTLSPRFSWRLAPNHRLTVTPFLTHTESDRNGTVQRTENGLLSNDRTEQNTRRTSGRLATEWKNIAGGGTETSARLMLQGESEESGLNTRRTGNSPSSSDERTTRREQEWMAELRRKQLFFDAHLLSGAIEMRASHAEDAQQRSGAANNAATLDDRRQVAWIQDEWQVADQHVLTPGLRWQTLSTRIEDTQAGVVDRTHRSLDPSLHYLWQLTPQWNLRASVAQNMKAPHTRDLSPYARMTTGVNSSSNPDRGGNAQLEPEKLRSIEIGVEHFLPGQAGTIGLSAFDRRIEDYIQRLVQFDGGSGRWVERPYNVGTAQLRGVLFDFKAKMNAIDLPTLTLRGNLGYTHIEMLEKVAGLGAGEGPRKSANFGVDYEIPSIRLTTGGNFNYVSALDRESGATVTQMQGARRQLDLYALYKLDRQLALRFSAQNVLRQGRDDAVTTTDGSGQIVQTANTQAAGIASYWLTLEGKW